jgi:hypothetical protein
MGFLMQKLSSKVITSTNKTGKKTLKTIKSQIKDLIKASKAPKLKTKKKGKKKKTVGNLELNKAGSEIADSVTSELDLVKSAILNKKFYEDSIALAESSSADDLAKRI